MFGGPSMRYDELVRRIIGDFPDGTVTKDDDGELVIHTGLHENPEGDVADLD